MLIKTVKPKGRTLSILSGKPEGLYPPFNKPYYHRYVRTNNLDNSGIIHWLEFTPATIR